LKTHKERALKAARDAIENSIQEGERERKAWAERTRFFPLPVKLPVARPPFYLSDGMEALDRWAQDLCDREARDRIPEATWQEIANVLLRISASKLLRRAVFPPGDSPKRGRPSIYARRDFLIALDYEVRRKKSARRGSSKRDIDETVKSLQKFGIGLQQVRRIRGTWGKQARTFLNNYLARSDLLDVGIGLKEKLDRFHDGVRIELSAEFDQYSDH
jgi:hypothetical protein